ncbi:ABC transporter ATP-binding protein [Bacillus sp. 31A1R]|uniref:ABC transporter ATP-binding protein n=1 Tax=Robertmurraya mangrovi TaxID=3098077 RepID=A0ABU5IWJ2_9BACI|nr:ABC transporter ATP-binding protein [Bacillus sp. 31A1R]MDZ5471518.1 ABC transporter ATP-binding protein [Bacillus sp. 31A1R]
MIKFENVSKRFEDKEAVEEVNLSINKGSIYGLLGSNGAGKTTLLKLLSGIYTQDSGHVTIDEKMVYENPDVKRRLFFIPDYPYFFSQYTIRHMGSFYRNMYDNWNEERFNHLVKAFDIDPNRKLHKYSKGLQRQAAFILALSTMPEILVLDEPMDGLDPVVRKNIKSLIIEDVAEREMTVLISSHNLREVEDICDFVGILHKGKMLIEKELDDLKSDTHKIQLAFKDGAPEGIFEGLKVLHQENRGSVLLCIVRGNEDDIVKKVKRFDPVIFDMLPLTLEEIFIYEMEDVGYAIKNILV